ncbi:unnamed protein product, partial [Polarella glacialis]
VGEAEDRAGRQLPQDAGRHRRKRPLPRGLGACQAGLRSLRSHAARLLQPRGGRRAVRGRRGQRAPRGGEDAGGAAQERPAQGQ